MKTQFLRGIAIALGLAFVAGEAMAQEGAPSLLPIPVTYTTPYYAGHRQEGPPQVDAQSAPSPSDAGSGNVYQQAMQQSWTGCDACDGGCDGGSCGMGGGYGCGAGGCGGGFLNGGRMVRTMSAGDNCHAWFVGAQGLLMTRDNANPYFFSFDGANEARQLLDAREANQGWDGGFQINVGRYFNCGDNAFQFIYWGVYPNLSTAEVRAGDTAGGLQGILNWNDLTYNGATADNWVDNALIHSVEATYDYQNFEWNLLGFQSQPCSRLNFNWVAGVRYFRFQEGIKFCSDSTDGILNGDPEEIIYYIDVANHLIGAQIGGAADYCINNRWKLNVGTKFGIYGNHIRHHSDIGGTAGIAFINNGPNVNRDFNIDSTKNDVAFIGEANVGLGYRINNCWTATLGYRAMAVSGVALTTNQIWSDLRGLQDVERVDSNGSLILHGGYAGAEFNF